MVLHIEKLMPSWDFYGLDVGCLQNQTRKTIDRGLETCGIHNQHTATRNPIHGPHKRRLFDSNGLKKCQFVRDRFV